MTGLDKFPRSTFLGLSGTQVVVGVILVLIGIVDIIITIQTIKDCEHPRFHHQRDFFDDSREKHGMFGDDDSWEERERRFRPEVMDGAASSWAETREWCNNYALLVPSYYCVGIWVGILMIVTGSIGLGAARSSVAHRQSGLKTGYIALNIMMVLCFLPILEAVGVAEAILSSDLVQDYMDGKMRTRMAFGIILAIIAFIQFVFGIVCASFACCCAPVTDVQVVHVPAPVNQVHTPAVMYGYTPTVAVTEKAVLVDNEVAPEDKATEA